MPHAIKRPDRRDRFVERLARNRLARRHTHRANLRQKLRVRRRKPFIADHAPPMSHKLPAALPGDVLFRVQLLHRPYPPHSAGSYTTQAPGASRSTLILANSFSGRYTSPPNLKHIRRLPLQPQRNRPDRPRPMRHIIALDPIPPRQSPEPAAPSHTEPTERQAHQPWDHTRAPASPRPQTTARPQSPTPAAPAYHSASVDSSYVLSIESIGNACAKVSNPSIGSPSCRPDVSDSPDHPDPDAPARAFESSASNRSNSGVRHDRLALST